MEYIHYICAQDGTSKSIEKRKINNGNINVLGFIIKNDKVFKETPFGLVYLGDMIGPKHKS